MNLPAFLIQMQSLRLVETETIKAATAPVEQPACGNTAFPRPCHDPAVNNGCSEWDIEPIGGEWANDGTPCVYVVL